jgi:hypothetical protein
MRPFFRPRSFWQDTLVTDSATVVVQYVNGWLIPTVYIRNGGRRYPAAVLASRFVGPTAEDEREWEMGLISAALGAAASEARGAVAIDPVFEKQCPTLFAFMTVTEEDGKPRSPSSLVVFTEDGQWKGCLSEKDAGLQLWRTGETLQKLLGSLEKALAGGNADWRRRYVPEGKGRPSRAKK